MHRILFASRSSYNNIPPGFKEIFKLSREKILRITEEQRKLGRKIVTVQGMGFVGCVMAIVIADAVDANGEPIYYVHGHQRTSKRSYGYRSSG